MLQEIIPKTKLLNSRFHDLLTKLLEWDASKRITVRDALRHPYFTINVNVSIFFFFFNFSQHYALCSR